MSLDWTGLGATPVRFGENAAVNGVELRQLRHPLLVWRDNGQAPNASAVVPMDFEVPDFVRAVVVTGPNTGGKTVSLKTLGISALMAKAGLWLLCEGFQGDADGEVEVPWFDRVMADIGDEQSIAQSLSTFSAHVARMKAIMEASTPDSYAAEGSNPGLADPKQVCYSSVWPSPWTGSSC